MVFRRPWELYVIEMSLVAEWSWTRAQALSMPEWLEDRWATALYFIYGIRQSRPHLHIPLPYTDWQRLMTDHDEEKCKINGWLNKRFKWHPLYSSAGPFQLWIQFDPKDKRWLLDFCFVCLSLCSYVAMKNRTPVQNSLLFWRKVPYEAKPLFAFLFIEKPHFVLQWSYCWLNATLFIQWTFPK